MYDDYPVIYESTVNQFLFYKIALIVILVLIFVVLKISLAKIHKKANRSAISSLIPIYNAKTIIEITHLPKILILFYIIPGLNIIAYIRTMFKLTKLFKKSRWFALGTIFLPIIFLPILAFDDSEFLGINVVAIEGKKTITDIPEIDLNRKQEIEIEINDKIDESLKGMDISIGGGKYQKKYTNNLIGLEQDQVLATSAKKEEVQTQKVTVRKNTNNNNSGAGLFNVAYIETPSAPQPTQTPVQHQQNAMPNNVIPQPVQQPVQPKAVPNNVIPTPVTQQPVQNNPVPNNVIPTPIQPQQPVQPQPSANEYVICPTCGAKLKANSKTCFICGKAI